MIAKERIEPFKIITGTKSTSVILNVGEYKSEIFAERESDGFEGNGYDWGSLAAVFLEERLPELKADIHFDPEGSMFCAYSSNVQAIEQFAMAFRAMCEDAAQMRELLSRAELD